MAPLTGSIVHHASGIREPTCVHAYYNHVALKQDGYSLWIQPPDSFVELIIKRAEMMIAEQPDFYLEYTGLNYSHSVLPASIIESNCF